MQSSYSLFQRIRCVKSSLDKAEQSFLENKEIRGELDLMLAEAELKNLRRKKDVPWSWSRHVLACGAALLLVLSCFGGWYVAKDYYRQALPGYGAETAVSEGKTTKLMQGEVSAQAVSTPMNIDDTTVSKEQVLPAANRVHISQADMRRLVQSAKVELSNSR